MGNKLFVGNIDWNATEDDLKNLFSQHGTVEEAVIVKDKFSGRSKGFGFVTFASEDEAKAAMEALDGHDLNGRKIAVKEALPPKQRD